MILTSKKMLCDWWDVDENLYVVNQLNIEIEEQIIFKNLETAILSSDSHALVAIHSFDKYGYL